MILSPYRFATGGGGSGFWTAIAALSPHTWLRMNEASGATCVNYGSLGNATYNGTLDYSQGSLCSPQAGANSIATNASGEYVLTTMASAAGATGLLGLCYAGTGTGSASTVILWRGGFVSTGLSYLRIDGTNIVVQPDATTGAVTTSVLSSTIKDGNPHLIMLGHLSGDETNLRLWIDGVNVWTHAMGIRRLDLGGDMVVGRNGSTSQYAYGRFADVFIKKAYPSSADVAAINAAWAP